MKQWLSASNRALLARGWAASVAALAAPTEWPRLLLTGLVRFYRYWLQPWLGHVCPYQPSCSAYALLALKRHGAAQGAALAGWRLLRCNPWCSGGNDPVPAEGELSRRAQGLFTRLLATASGRGGPSSIVVDVPGSDPASALAAGEARSALLGTGQSGRPRLQPQPHPQPQAQPQPSPKACSGRFSRGPAGLGQPSRQRRNTRAAWRPGRQPSLVLRPCLLGRRSLSPRLKSRT